MIATVPPSFTSAWQGGAPTLGTEQILELLELQLDSPSFAVPVAHPVTPGEIAYAQALYLPVHALPIGLVTRQTTGTLEPATEAIQGLVDSGRILEAGLVSTSYIEQRHGFLLILVVRSDDPVLAQTSTPTL